MRGLYRTSRLAARSGARSFDVGVMKSLQATAPDCEDVMTCNVSGPLADEGSLKDVANVRMLDENNDGRFEFDVDKIEAMALAQFFDAIARQLR